MSNSFAFLIRLRFDFDLDFIRPSLPLHVDPQRSLFDTDPEPWEADDQAEQLVAGIVLATGPAQEFDYLVPDALRDQVEPGRRVLVPLGKGNRQVQGYCVRVESRPAGPRLLKPLAEVVDRRSLLSPAMLRLTRWIADYYLCPWGQVLETVLPAGVRGQAGTRMATLLTLDPRGAELLAAATRTHHARDRRSVMSTIACRTSIARSSAPWPQRPSRSRRRNWPARPVARRPPSPRCAAKGSSARQTARVSTARQAEAALPREEHLPLNPDQQKALDAVLAALRSQQHRTLADPRRDRQRQDGGLYPGDRRGGALRPAGDRAGAGDQSHAADRRAFSPAVRRRRRAAQPLERRRPVLALAADRRRPGVGGRRRAQRRLRPHAAPGPDRPGRRARIDLQAGNRSRAITPARWPWPGPRPRTCRWSSVPPRLPWKAGTVPAWASIN